MSDNLQISKFAKTLALIVIFVHLMFFILEALFWMKPEVHTILLDFLDNPVTVDYNVQALTLRNLFINQGFYNLFLVCGGLAGLSLVRKKKYAIGYALVLFLCFSARCWYRFSMHNKSIHFSSIANSTRCATFYKIIPCL